MPRRLRSKMPTAPRTPASGSSPSESPAGVGEICATHGPLSTGWDSNSQVPPATSMISDGLR